MGGFRALIKQWQSFLSIILNPWVIILIIPTGFLMYQASVQTNQTITTILSLLIALSSSLLGGVIANKWSAINDESVLNARGRSAVRSLKLLLINIAAIERRVLEYLSRTKDNKTTMDIAAIYLEEVSLKCRTLQEDVINSIENWTDIVPEADIKTQIGIISELRDQIQVKEDERLRLSDDFEETKKKSKEEGEKLLLLIQQKEKELNEAKNELRRRSIDIGLTYPESRQYIISGSHVIDTNSLRDVKITLGTETPVKLIRKQEDIKE